MPKVGKTHYPYTKAGKAAAAAAKKKRDIEYASKQYRIDRRSENQASGEQSSEYDLHHKPDGSVVKMSIKNNRNVWKHGERT